MNHMFYITAMWYGIIALILIVSAVVSLRSRDLEVFGFALLFSVLLLGMCSPEM